MSMADDTTGSGRYGSHCFVLLEPECAKRWGSTRYKQVVMHSGVRVVTGGDTTARVWYLFLGNESSSDDRMSEEDGGDGGSLRLYSSLRARPVCPDRLRGGRRVV